MLRGAANRQPSVTSDAQIRTYDYFSHVRRHGYTYWRSPGFSHLATEVVVTEYVYNFGPRKLMRRLVFEGGVLVSIESIGYGYHD